MPIVWFIGSYIALHLEFIWASLVPDGYRRNEICGSALFICSGQSMSYDEYRQNDLWFDSPIVSHRAKAADGSKLYDDGFVIRDAFTEGWFRGREPLFRQNIPRLVDIQYLPAPYTWCNRPFNQTRAIGVLALAVSVWLTVCVHWYSIPMVELVMLFGLACYGQIRDCLWFCCCCHRPKFG